MPDGGSTPTESREHANAFGVDGIDCITADDPTQEEPVQVCDDSSDPMQDSDLSESVWADRAVIPSRTNTKPLQLAETSFGAVTLHDEYDLGNAPILLLVTHCFYSLHEHIRERAPPGLG